MELPFAPVPVDPGTPELPQSTLAAVAVSTIELGLLTSPRSLQSAIGASEVGRACARQLAYKLCGVRPCNIADPMRLLVGTGVHLELERVFNAADAGAGRFLTEVPIVYRDIPGKADLVDRYLHAVLDWKTISKQRLAGLQKANAVPPEYEAQIQIYASGLMEQGYDIRRVAVVFLPYDGALTSTWAWEAKPDRRAADAAIDRLEELRGKAPSEVPPTPDRTCGYCPFYNPRATDLNRGCPGTKGNQHGGLGAA